MKLYYSPGACSLAPHIIIHELNLPYEKEKVDLKLKKTESGDDFLKINPRGYVPALLLDDNSLLTESAVILQYLSDQDVSKGLMPAFGTRERYTLLSWLQFISTEIHKSFSPLFKENTPQEYVKISKDSLLKRFAYLSEHLSNHKFMMGDQFTIADAYLFTVLRWTRMLNISIVNWPSLTEYLTLINDRASVRSALEAEKVKL